MGTVTNTVTLIPSGTIDRTNMTTSTSYPESRGYNDTTNTSFARWTLSTSTTGYIYYTFDASSIPAGATITSVTAKARCYVGNTTRVTNTQCQLFSGTTAKGSNTTFASTSSSNIVTLSPGNSWSRSDFNDLRIKIGATGSSSTSSKYVYFAGAEVTVTYSVTTYDISATGDGTLNPASATVASGSSYTLTISDLNSKPTVTDNNVDVTSQLTESHEETNSYIPDSSSISTFTTSTISNAYTGADSDTYADLQLAGSSTGTVYLDIGGINIPAGSTIQSVTCSVTLEYNGGSSSSGFTSSFQMYANTTAKGSSYQWVSSATSVAKNTYSLTVGSWSLSELNNNPRFYLTATNSARSTARHVYIYGVTFTITYESDGVVYKYTISNVTGNHTIVVSSGSSSAALYVKANGSWVPATAVYKKVNGSWVQQSDLTNVFDPTKNYVKG